MLRRRVAGQQAVRGSLRSATPSLFTVTPTRQYVYQPPGTSTNETSRLPWYTRTAATSTSTVNDVAVAAAKSTAPPPHVSSLHAQDISAILQNASLEDGPVPTHTASVTPTAGATQAESATVHLAAQPVPSTTAASSPSSTSAPASAAAQASSPSSVSVAVAAAAAAAATAAARRRTDSGALRLTPTCRMSALSGPTLDARVEDIVKVEEALASELTLLKVVQLLIDPQAEGVERITMGEFAAMQPRRQLLAVGGKREWLQWIEQSTYYQQAARLSAESPAQDLAALQQAGITTLQQWLEHPQLVKVSARTRSALDTAVAQSVEAYMAEVAQVVNMSNEVEVVLSHWVSDVMGKFILDSLQIPVERASQAMWATRKDWLPAEVVRSGGGGGEGAPSSTSAAGTPNTSAAGRGTDVTGGGAPQSAESRMLSDLLSSTSSNGGGGGGGGVNASPASATGTSTSSSAQQQSVLRPGEACTLDHYLRFVQKVVSSVRQDYAANHAAMLGRGDAQAEQEISERSYGVIAAAFTQLLEQAVAHHLPRELATLQQNGYLALDRVPGLLKRAGNLLQLRSVPVRYFVLHSTIDEGTAATSAGGRSAATRNGGRGDAAAATVAANASTATVSVDAPPYYPPGTFLTGSNQMDVTLGEWTGRPDPPSSTARESGGVVDDATEQEYLSLLHRMRRRVDTLAVTSLYEVLAQPERFGGNGFRAEDAIGLHQLFGPVKLLEDRLTTALHYPVAASEKPLHFVEAGPLSGKTALLEQLAERTTRPGDKVVVVRYGGSATPYLPDLDDHPVAFAARFWFRVALASCPYLIRTEELYSRAPRSVFWWGHEKNWSWERYQSLLQSARNAGAGHRQHQQQQQRVAAAGSAAAAPPAQLASILVDDVDRALGAMQLKWGDAAALSAAAVYMSQNSLTASAGAGGGGYHVLNVKSMPAATVAAQKAQQAEEEDEDALEDANGGADDDETSDARSTANARRASGSLLSSSPAGAAGVLPTPSLEQQRQQVVSLWHATGKSVHEHLSSCFTQLSAAVGQVNIVFTGTAVSPLLLSYCAAPCRRHYLPLSGGVGLQSRLRVLPLLATLHALHLTHHLDMPGLLYEVLKNCPALTGKALELFWSHRVSTMDLRTGQPRLTMGSGSAHPQLMQSYVPRELFAELPLYTSLLQNPRRTRRRLVELLQRQLSSPTGYLSTELDTTPQDVKDGLVLPHNLTSSQVHPFALFAIFSRQDAIDERVFNSDGQLLESSEAAADGNEDAAAAGADDDYDGESGGGASVNGKNSNSNALSDAAAAARVRSSTGVGSNERKVVRAWAEVWAEYRSVVAPLSTSPSRKRDAMRVLLHGALLLRSAAVAGAQLELNLKVPSYGFPLLASDTRVRGSSGGGSHHHGRGDAQVRPATADTVRRATAAYKMFFSNAAPSHFPFRPMVGLNGGCDVVFVCGSTLALYDIVTTAAQVRQMVGRFAEALLGVLHVLERQVFPVDKVRALQFVTVVSLDEVRPGLDMNASFPSSGYNNNNNGRRRLGNSGSGGSSLLRSGPGSSSMTAGGLNVDVFNRTAAPTVPYYLDYSAVFDDDVMDRLRTLQQTLGITRDFRTLNELIDEVERTHRVRVMQDVVSTPEEVESLFSPTLLQLVPDSTVLPAYTSALVSATDLMMLVMKGGAAAKSNSNNISSGSGGVNAATGGSSGGGASVMHELDGSVNLHDADDDDDDADYVNLGEEELIPGAELDDVASDVRLSRDPTSSTNPLAADHEHLHESAELLEAMMNDNLDMMTDSSGRLQRQHDQTARDLRQDLVMEDRINYNAPAPNTAARAAGSSPSSSPPPSSPRRAGAGRTPAEEAEADALAWLHDIITPESLIAGLKGTAPGAGTPLSNAVISGPGNAAGTPAAAVSPIQAALGQRGHSAPATSMPPVAAAAAGIAEPWTPNAPAAVDGTENISAVFPRTAAKRDGSAAAGENGNPALARGAAAADGRGDGDADAEDDEDDEEAPVSPEKGGATANNSNGNEEDDEELNLQQLFDAVGSRRRQRGANRASAGRRSSDAKSKRGGSSRGSAGAKGKNKAAASSSSASGKRGRGAGSSSAAGKKKAKPAAASAAKKTKKNSSSAKKKK